MLARVACGDDGQVGCGEERWREDDDASVVEHEGGGLAESDERGQKGGLQPRETEIASVVALTLDSTIESADVHDHIRRMCRRQRRVHTRGIC